MRSTANLTKKELIDRVLRVDLAGEYGARRIYEGQLAVLAPGSAEAIEVRRMYEQELFHLDTMSKLLVQHRARPSLLGPLWHVGGFALGAATALLGKEAAMACTVAVETEISQHYNSQLRDILARADTADMKELQEILQKFRDDEIDHMHSATEHGAAGAPAYNMLVEVIRAVTRTAVKVAERV